MFNAKKIAWNTLYQVFGKILTSSLGVIITIVLTRYLGPAGYGKYTFVIVFVTLFGAVADWGMSLIGVREASKKEEKTAEIVGSLLLVRSVSAIVAFVLCNLIVWLLPYSVEIKTLITIVSISILTTALKTSFQVIFNVKLKMEYFALSEISANFLCVFLVVGLVWMHASLMAIVLSFLAGNFFSMGVAWFLGMRLTNVKFSISGPHTKTLILESLPMGAILVVFTIYNRIDTVILESFKGQTVVGYYGAAYRIYEVLVLGAAYFANSILPLISNLADQKDDRLKRVYEKSFVFLLGVGTMVMMVSMVLAPLGIWIVAGKNFGPSVGALRLLSLALMVSYLNHLSGYTLVALGKQKWSLFIAVIALGVNVLLNLLVIPRFSLNGAAITTFATEGLIVILSLMCLRKFIGIDLSPANVYAVIVELWRSKGKIWQQS